MPNYLYNYKNFSADFEKEIINKKNNKVIKKLVKKITPFILRRTKKEVLKDLPDKIETIRYAQMGDQQRKVYEAQLLRTRNLIEKEKNKIEILSALTRLRQICVHPQMFLDEYIGESTKVDLLLELLDELISNNHKVLVFSQFTTVFDTLSQKLSEKGIDHFILTGKTNALLRVEMADIFNDKNSSQKVFLISLKAGGTGLNLVGADTVIQLDPWWNVAAENQASDRAHRIGQKNIVQVIKLICENSIEQKVLELQELKKDIISKVIADNDENIVKMNDNDLKYLLG
jgi:SNF2 family DNA or RNA helicase